MCEIFDSQLFWLYNILILLYRNSGKWRLRGGGGGGGGEVGAENSVPSAALPKQQPLAEIGFHGTLLLNSTNFILSWKMLIGFYLVNLLGMLKCINLS